MDDSEQAVAATSETPPEHPPVDLPEVGRRLDIIGQQLDWLCENMASLFAFVNQMGQSGGGIRGIMHALKNSPPELGNQPEEDTTKVGN